VPLSGPAARLTNPLRQNEVLLVVSISTMLVMLGQGITGPILPLFAKSLGVSTAAVGLTLSAFAIARMFLNIPSGLVADRWGRRVLLIGGPVITGLGSVLSGTATTLEWLLVWRFVAGVGSAMYMTGAIIVVTDIATDQNRGRMLAVNQGALLAGITLGPAVGGITAEVFGLRAPFYVVGVAALAAGVWNWLRVPETRPVSLPAAPAGATAAAPARASAWTSTLTLLLSLNFMVVALVNFAVFFARAGRQTVIPLYADQEIGLSAGPIGLVFALMAFINLLFIIPAGWAIDRFGVKVTIVPSALVSLLAFAMIAASHSAMTFVFATVILGVGSGMLGPAPAAYAAEIAPVDRRGAAMGLFRSLGDAGFVISPPLVGYLADESGFGSAILINGIVLAGSALVFAVLAGRRRTLAGRTPSPSPAP
jgi:MFS family permease